MLHRKRLLICLMCLFMAVPIVSAEGQIIALHPIQADDKEAADIYYDMLLKELLALPAGYSVFMMDVDHPPPDVPVGGFPPHICPSPSLTQHAPYAITGEVVNAPHSPGNYRLRLYLWEMEDNRILAFDEMTALDHGGEKQMQYLLSWLLSWIGREKPVRVVERVVPQEAEKQGQQTQEKEEPAQEALETINVEPVQAENVVKEIEHWLYLGIRGGGGSSQWYNDQNHAYGFPNQDITSFWAANASLQVSLHIFRYFDIQTEANFAADIGSLGDIKTGSITSDGVFVNWYMTVPLLFKLNFSNSKLKIGLYAGAYYYLPLAQMNNDMLGGYFDYEPSIPGVTFGTTLGWKIGPGCLFFDSRFEYDGRWYSDTRDVFYYRNLIKFNLGYEIGLIKKRSK